MRRSAFLACAALALAGNSHTVGHLPGANITAQPTATYETLELEAVEFANIIAPTCDEARPDELEHFRLPEEKWIGRQLLSSMTCARGAYNIMSVWFITSQGGSQLLSFAEPMFDLEYVEGSDSAKIEKLDVIGFAANTRVVNAAYDPKAGTFTIANKFRGVGDASSFGTWRLESSQPVLTNYEIDATYDGEINPVTVVKDSRLVK